MKLPLPFPAAGRALVTALLLCSAHFLPAADKLPVEVFSRWPAIIHPTISRDGKTLCYGAVFDKDRAMLFKDLDGTENYAVDIVAKASLGSPRWVAEDRVVYGRMAGIDRDAKNYKGLLGQAREDDLRDQQRIIAGGILFARFGGKKDGAVLMNEFDFPTDYAARYGIAYLNYPNVIEMDTRTGVFGLVLKNPGKITGWICDGAGVVRVGVEQDNGMSRIIYRQSAAEPWRVAAGLDFAKRGVQPIYLSADGSTLYVSLVTPAGNWGVYSYDLAKQKMGNLILSHDHYDILPYGFTVSQDGFDLDKVVFAPKTREVLGIQFVTDKPRVVWFDPQMAQVQEALNQNFPGKINTIVDMSDNQQRMIVLSWSANDFGTYYLFDLAKKQLKPLFQRAPWIKPEQMAEVKPISYPSRDGLTIHGYLTLPKGADPKKLPMVVYPHGGPFARDSYDFDYDAQFLANRGYAVLQMNYRGSPGYGEAFAKKGMRSLGRGIQDDIEDGTRWAIAQGIADPGRIAIMGWSFGGYSAAIGPMRAPELYRCAINMAGVTDWKALMKYDIEVSPVRRQTTADYIGDPVADAAELDDISPVNHVDKLRVPMLLVYGKDDTTVPYDQMKLLTAALDREHKQYEVLARANEGHGFGDVKHRAELYNRIEQFLAKNMAPR
jgi:dipeptidyl aminopeptidase/acylaminoacyl peptidase